MIWGLGWIILLLVGGFYASYSIRAGIYVKAFCRAKTKRRVIALTFDDGPDEVQTPLVLDILKAYGVKATFFCIGEKVLQNKGIVERMVNEGHALGNHSWSHSTRFPLFSRKRMRRELEETRVVLEEVAKSPVTLFRPPFGVTNPTVAKVVKGLRYKVIGWNVRSLDTCSKDVEIVFGRVKRKIVPGSVVLLHDRLPMSGVLLERILQFLKVENYEVCRIEEMFDL